MINEKSPQIPLVCWLLVIRSFTEFSLMSSPVIMIDVLTDGQMKEV